MMVEGKRRVSNYDGDEKFQEEATFTFPPGLQDGYLSHALFSLSLHVQRHSDDEQYVSDVSMQNFNTMLDLLSDAVIVYDHVGTVVQINAVARRWLAKRLDLFTQPYEQRFTCFTITDFQGQPLALEQTPLFLLLHDESGERLEHMRVVFHFPDGQDLPMSVSGTKLRDPEMHVIGAMLFMRAPTERDTLENFLQAQEQAAQLKAILESMPDALLVYDAQGHMRQMNAAGRRFLDRLSLSDAASNSVEQRRQIAAYTEQGEAQPYEAWPITRILSGETLTPEQPVDYMLCDLDEQEFYVSATGAPLYNREGQLSGGVYIGRDITMRKQAELTMQAQTQRLQTQADLFALAYDAILIHDPNNRIISWNQGAEQLYGWAAHEAIGQVAYTLLQTVFPCPRDTLMNLLAHDGRWEGELTHTRRDGTKIVVESRWAMAHDESVFLEINRDITGRKHLERLQQQDIAAIKKAEQIKEEFLLLATHELRTPLTVLINMVYLLQRHYRKEEFIPEEVRMALELLKDTGQQLAQLNTMLLNAALLQTKQMSVVPQQVDLLILVQDVITRLQETTSIHQLSLHKTLERLIVNIDPKLIEEVITNIVNNAIKYSPNGGPIEVTVWVDARMCEALLSVRDEGMGISFAKQSRVFERFVRGEMVFHIRGIGLGLFISRALMELQGGRIWFQSTEGQGSTFFLAFPFVTSDT